MIQYFFNRTNGCGLKWLPVALLAFILSGCLDEEKNDIKPIPLGYVSLYHAAPDAEGVDISVDGNRINDGSFDYTNYTGYLNFYTGERNIEFRSHNAANALVDTTLSVSEGKVYSIFLVNRASDLETLIIADSSASPAEGKAMIRFIQLSPDAPEVDVTYSKEGEESLSTNSKFKDASAFTEVPADTYLFRVKNSDTGDVLVEADEIQIRSGRFYTIITRGFATPPSGNTNSLNLEVL